MDDPGWSEILIVFLSIAITAGLARLNSIGNVLSRTTVERLKDIGFPRTGLYLKLYRSRDFMNQSVVFAQIVITAIGAFAFLALIPANAVENGPGKWLLQGIVLIAYTFLTLLIRSFVPPYRREEGSDRPLPVLLLFFSPLQMLFFLPSLILQNAQNLLVSEDDTKARKEEELRNFVESETEEGTIEAEEGEMIVSVFEFGEKTVKEVMIPRMDMVCADMNSPIQDVLELIRQSRHSRIPIYEDRIDNIKGVVYVKDLLYLGNDKPWTIADIMREPYFVPENKALDDLLAEFKKEKVHIAIVVGEYGGTSGLITMEDIIEEIVGEIQDEYDEEEPLYHWIEEDRTLIVDARIDIEDLNPLINVELPQDGYETLGGFIYNQLGHVPVPDETLTFGNLRMMIKEVNGQRITRVCIEKNEIKDDSSPESTKTA